MDFRYSQVVSNHMARYISLIEKTSVHTNENLHTYKSLDAYDYVPCGRVQKNKVL